MVGPTPAPSSTLSLKSWAQGWKSPPAPHRARCLAQWISAGTEVIPCLLATSMYLDSL